MKIQIFKLKESHSRVNEIIIVKSDNKFDPLTHTVPPVGVPEIIFYVDKSHQINNVPCKHGFIKGQFNTSQEINFIPGYHFISFRLHPYGLRQLFGWEACQFLNSVVDIEQHPFTRAMMNFLNSKYYIDEDLIKKMVHLFDQLNTFSISRTTQKFINASAVNNTKSIKDIAYNLGIGIRTLQRHFKREVGYSPKEFLRINRLNAIENQLSESVNIFQIIADHDFSDQSHFVKEFKLLRNHSPGDFIKKKLLLSQQLPRPEFKVL